MNEEHRGCNVPWQAAIPLQWKSMEQIMLPIGRRRKFDLTTSRGMCAFIEFAQAAEYFVGSGVAGHDPVADDRKQIGIGEQLTACRIGMDDAAVRVEQADRGVQSVEDVGKVVHRMRACPDLTAHDLRPMDVRSEQPHALAHRLVDGSAGAMAQHLQDRGARGRFLERDGRKVYRPLRLHPLAVEARLEEVRMGHDVGHADRLFGREGEMTVEQRIELHIPVAIKLTEAGVGSKMLVNLDRKPR
ncbi:hypothetical protein GGD61_006770 [Bradyrhizobium sp. SBR1B]|nr:hypothetical protein [Bradyrhizobium sp. SBR1B]